MKKISLYLTSLLFAIAFVSCDEDYNKNIAPPQGWEQEPAQDVNFVIANIEEAYDLNKITEEAFNIVKKNSLPVYNEGTTISYVIHFSDSEEFLSKDVRKVTLESDNYSIARSDVQSVVEKFYGKRPVGRELYLRVIASIHEGNSQIMIRSNALTIGVTPEAPVIETAYYLVGGVTGWNGGDVSTLLKFDHSGNDVYDDPYFTALINVGTDGGWKIVPQSAVTAVENGEASDIWGAAMGTDTDGDTSLTGAFGPEKGGAMKIDQAGWAKITLDMMSYTYEVEIIGEMVLELYAPGGYQGWDPATARTVYTKNMDMKYDGYINIAGSGWTDGFKFVNGPAWPDAGNGYRDYGTDSGGEPGNLTGGDNVTVAEEGFYRVTVDLSGSAYTYKAEKTVWGIIGDATSGGWDTSTDMTLDAATYIWSVTTNLIGGKEFKFRANDGWDINLGGDTNDLIYGGDNIVITEDGEYTITLNLSNPKAYKATITKN